MADLGSIQVTDPNAGVTPVTRNAELSALNTGLTVVGKTIDEAAKADLRGDLSDAQRQALEAAQAAEVQPTFNEYENIEDSQAVVGFVNQMRKHQAMASQATSSNLRSRAVLAMQQELQGAKNKYPWMRGELDQAASRFMGTSPTLSALGMIDSAIKAGTHPAAQSQDWIDGIKENAYGKGPNQLGMDERIEFGTPAFARQYDQKQERLQARLGLERDEQLAKAQDVSDTRVLVTVGTRQLESREGTLTAMYDDFSLELDQIHQARVQHRTGSISESALIRQEDEWQRVVRPTLILRLNEAKAALRDGYNQLIPFHLQDEPDSIALKGRMDTHIEDIETLESVLTADNTNISELISTLSLMRGQARLESAPTLNDFTDLAAVSEKALTAMASMDFSFASAYDQQMITDGMGPEIMTSMFPSLAASFRDSFGEEDPNARRNRRTDAYTRSSAPGGRVTTSDPKEIAMDSISQVLQSTKAVGTPELQDPVADGLNLGRTAGNLQNLTMAMPEGLSDPDTLALRMALSSTDWVGAIDRVGKSSADTREWVANMEQDYLGVIDPPKEAVTDIVDTASQKMGGFTGPAALTLLDVDVDFDTGQASFTVNPNKVEAAFPLTPEGDSAGQTALFGLGQSANDRVKSTRQSVQRELNAIAERLTEDVTAYARIQAHLNYAKNPALTKPEYGTAFVQPIPGAPALSTIFNIETE